MRLCIFSLIFLAGSFCAAFAQEDHSENFEEAFTTPQEVTAACLDCHDEAAEQVMATTHWTWKGVPHQLPGHANPEAIGKINVFNNFCIAVEGNWPRCTSCHAGYGWKDADFDFEKEENVDCLVCHDQTGTYKKSAAGAGMPVEGLDLLAIAKSVGPSTRQNCGACHFYSGGGDNVKHGDLDPGLIDPTPEMDVHMGNGMACQDCHETEEHQIKGKSFALAPNPENRLTCQSCHEDDPHDSKIINRHMARVACQTCHIPAYAKNLPTKTYWDWSTAGKDSTAPKDALGMETYSKKKGSFRWGQNLRPEYYWYNGTAERYLRNDPVTPGQPVALNKPLGNAQDPNRKLYPFKVMRGKQIYDTKRNTLIVPKLWEGFWTDFDWNKAAAEGMKAAGMEYSGSYGFIETEMYWSLNHMVAPKEQALKCTNCHGRGKTKFIDWKRLGYEKDQILNRYDKK